MTYLSGKIQCTGGQYIYADLKDDNGTEMRLFAFLRIADQFIDKIAVSCTYYFSKCTLKKASSNHKLFDHDCDLVLTVQSEVQESEDASTTATPTTQTPATPTPTPTIRLPTQIMRIAILNLTTQKNWTIKAFVTFNSGVLPNRQ